jgi:hypothetical protein
MFDFKSLKQKKGNCGLMTLNLDIEKAFDFMEWHFLFEILKFSVLTQFGYIGSDNVYP